MAMAAWVLRFGLFGVGDTNFPGIIWLILSCIVYGMAFDFFNVSGGLYVDKQTEPSLRSSAQGLFMLMTNGIGASVGTFIAGTFVVNKLVYVPEISPMQELAGWHESWLIFAAYSLVVAILFALIFKENDPKRTDRLTPASAKIASESAPVNAGGMVEEVEN